MMTTIPTHAVCSSLVVYHVRRLLPVAAATAWLDCSEERVRELMQSGELLAWDIRVPGATRAYERVYAPCVLCLAGGRKETFEADAAVESLLPRLEASLGLSTLHGRLNCSVQHVRALGEAWCWGMVTEGRPGPGGSAKVSRAEVVKWLRIRGI